MYSRKENCHFISVFFCVCCSLPQKRETHFLIVTSKHWSSRPLNYRLSFTAAAAAAAAAVTTHYYARQYVINRVSSKNAIHRRERSWLISPQLSSKRHWPNAHFYVYEGGQIEWHWVTSFLLVSQQKRSTFLCCMGCENTCFLTKLFKKSQEFKLPERDDTRLYLKRETQKLFKHNDHSTWRALSIRDEALIEMTSCWN